MAQQTLRSNNPLGNGASGVGRNNIVVFSGGSAANSLVDVFNNVREANDKPLKYVIPISDNGGSSSEIIRVFGGPGIGDVRSRLVRLIPEDGPEMAAIKRFFNHRLPKQYDAARIEWLDIVEARHSLWTDISTPKQELIRSFLNVFNLEVVKRLRPTSRFDFSGASTGNLFLTAARLFTGSFEAGIHLLSSICSVPSYVSVIPALSSNFANHIAAGLADGTIITGQNDISHPSKPVASVPLPTPSLTGSHSPSWLSKLAIEDQDHVEDANLPGSLLNLRKPAIVFSKDEEEDLPARIERIWYINPYGQEIRPPANPRVVSALNDAQHIIYCIGSLFTSIVPSLVLRGVGAVVASPLVRSKILILNGTLDRETGPSSEPFTALDFVAAIADACCNSQGLPQPGPDSYWQYVTHVIHLDGASTPKVDKDAFVSCGIETIRLYGRSNGKGGRYDARALEQALEAVIGRRDHRLDRTRRNTLIG
ncbi:hypothetical protein AMS68_000470 [Peltaster fructicola]|uniref:Uncharacterized protein n=1 Tax=Peltaster fructicola TaxID=286661 RepID=A0A6H0XJP2_9PEZI|nr:hypothetical protein AMS68_000470 [Peltaster fructicola]